MKSIIWLFVVVISISNAAAQKVTVEHATMNTNDGYNSAFVVFIPHASMRTVEKKWIEFLKDHNAKVKSTRSEISGKNVTMKAIGPDTLQIFSKIDEAPAGVSVTAAVSRGGTYFAPSTFPADTKIIERMLKDFATPIAKESLDDKVSVAAKLLSVKLLDLENLKRTDKRLASEIERMKVEISENERERKDIDKQVSNLDKDIEGQKGNLETIKNMAKDLE